MEVEVANVERFGLRLYVQGKVYILPYEEYAWFQGATIRQIVDVHLEHREILRWPELDIDLAVESIGRPEGFPLMWRERVTE